MDMPGDLAELARAVGHRFRDGSLLAAAITHPSMSGLERSGAAAANTTYERLEFLGDRVLGLVVAHWLLERHPTEHEGDLAKRHAGLVRREALCRVALAIGLGQHLRLAPGEADGGGRSNRTILADACEAVIGALYLDGGLETATRFIRAQWMPLIEDAGTPPPREPKTALQEWAQARGLPLPVYETVSQCGPAHEPSFEVRVTVTGQEPVSAGGSSKRTAEKNAAIRLLRQLGAPVDE